MNKTGQITNSAMASTPETVAFTGVVTKSQEDFGMVRDDVFFVKSVVKGPFPQVGDRVLVQAEKVEGMPFKYVAKRLQRLVKDVTQSSEVISTPPVQPKPVYCNTATIPSTNVQPSLPKEIVERFFPVFSSLLISGNEQPVEESNILRSEYEAFEASINSKDLVQENFTLDAYNSNSNSRYSDDFPGFEEKPVDPKGLLEMQFERRKPEDSWHHKSLIVNEQASDDLSNSYSRRNPALQYGGYNIMQEVIQYPTEPTFSRRVEKIASDPHSKEEERQYTHYDSNDRNNRKTRHCPKPPKAINEKPQETQVKVKSSQRVARVTEKTQEVKQSNSTDANDKSRAIQDDSSSQKRENMLNEERLFQGTTLRPAEFTKEQREKLSRFYCNKYGQEQCFICGSTEHKVKKCPKRPEPVNKSPKDSGKREKEKTAKDSKSKEPAVSKPITKEVVSYTEPDNEIDVDEEVEPPPVKEKRRSRNPLKNPILPTKVDPSKTEKFNKINKLLGKRRLRAIQLSSIPVPEEQTQSNDSLFCSKCQKFGHIDTFCLSERIAKIGAPVEETKKSNTKSEKSLLGQIELLLEKEKQLPSKSKIILEKSKSTSITNQEIPSIPKEFLVCSKCQKTGHIEKFCLSDRIAKHIATTEKPIIESSQIIPSSNNNGVILQSKNIEASTVFTKTINQPQFVQNPVFNIPPIIDEILTGCNRNKDANASQSTEKPVVQSSMQINTSKPPPLASLAKIPNPLEKSVKPATQSSMHIDTSKPPPLGSFANIPNPLKKTPTNQSLMQIDTSKPPPFPSPASSSTPINTAKNPATEISQLNSLSTEKGKMTTTSQKINEKLIADYGGNKKTVYNPRDDRLSLKAAKISQAVEKILRDPFPSNNTGNSGMFKGDPICYKCKKTGHSSNSCGFIQKTAALDTTMKTKSSLQTSSPQNPSKNNSPPSKKDNPVIQHSMVNANSASPAFNKNIPVTNQKTQTSNPKISTTNAQNISPSLIQNQLNKKQQETTTESKKPCEKQVLGPPTSTYVPKSKQVTKDSAVSSVPASSEIQKTAPVGKNGTSEPKSQNSQVNSSPKTPSQVSPKKPDEIVNQSKKLDEKQQSDSPSSSISPTTNATQSKEPDCLNSQSNEQTAKNYNAVEDSKIQSPQISSSSLGQENEDGLQMPSYLRISSERQIDSAKSHLKEASISTTVQTPSFNAKRPRSVEYILRPGSTTGISHATEKEKPPEFKKQRFEPSGFHEPQSNRATDIHRTPHGVPICYKCQKDGHVAKHCEAEEEPEIKSLMKLNVSTPISESSNKRKDAPRGSTEDKRFKDQKTSQKSKPWESSTAPQSKCQGCISMMLGGTLRGHQSNCLLGKNPRFNERRSRGEDSRNPFNCDDRDNYDRQFSSNVPQDNYENRRMEFNCIENNDFNRPHPILEEDLQMPHGVPNNYQDNFHITIENDRQVFHPNANNYSEGNYSSRVVQDEEYLQERRDHPKETARSRRGGTNIAELHSKNGQKLCFHCDSVDHKARNCPRLQKTIHQRPDQVSERSQDRRNFTDTEAEFSERRREKLQISRLACNKYGEEQCFCCGSTEHKLKNCPQRPQHEGSSSRAIQDREYLQEGFEHPTESTQSRRSRDPMFESGRRSPIRLIARNREDIPTARRENRQRLPPRMPHGPDFQESFEPIGEFGDFYPPPPNFEPFDNHSEYYDEERYHQPSDQHFDYHGRHSEQAVCSYCHKAGHVSYDCWHYLKRVKHIVPL